MATKKTTTSRKRREKKNIERGTVHIQSTFNNDRRHAGQCHFMGVRRRDGL